jgi:hypothetical protein
MYAVFDVPDTGAAIFRSTLLKFASLLANTGHSYDFELRIQRLRPGLARYAVKVADIHMSQLMTKQLRAEHAINRCIYQQESKDA